MITDRNDLLRDDALAVTTLQGADPASLNGEDLVDEAVQKSKCAQGRISSGFMRLSHASALR